MCDQVYLAIAIAAIIIAIWYILMQKKSISGYETEGQKVNKVAKQLLYQAGQIANTVIDSVTGQ